VRERTQSDLVFPEIPSVGNARNSFKFSSKLVNFFWHFSWKFSPNYHSIISDGTALIFGTPVDATNMQQTKFTEFQKSMPMKSY
jgi:hypothetical protein